MFGRRRRRWVNIKTTLGQRLVFAGNIHISDVEPMHVYILRWCANIKNASGFRVWYIEPMLIWCWPTVYDVVPASTQHWFNASCLFGTQWARDIDLMVGQFWSTIYDAGPTLDKHWTNVWCLLGGALWPWSKDSWFHASWLLWQRCRGWASLIEIDSKFEQVGPDICHFIDLSLTIGGHLGNMQIQKLPLGKI